MSLGHDRRCDATWKHQRITTNPCWESSITTALHAPETTVTWCRHSTSADRWFSPGRWFPETQRCAHHLRMIGRHPDHRPRPDRAGIGCALYRAENDLPQPNTTGEFDGMSCWYQDRAGRWCCHGCVSGRSHRRCRDKQRNDDVRTGGAACSRGGATQPAARRSRSSRTLGKH